MRMLRKQRQIERAIIVGVLPLTLIEIMSVFALAGNEKYATGGIDALALLMLFFCAYVLAVLLIVPSIAILFLYRNYLQKSVRLFVLLAYACCVLIAPIIYVNVPVPKIE